MSATTLAYQLDRLPGLGAFVVETADTVSASNLSARQTRELCGLVEAEGWRLTIFDQANGSWTRDELDKDLAPFRLTIFKPPAGIDAVRILTDVGFAAWLAEPSASVCQVARLSRPFETLGVRFTGWDEPVSPFEPAEETASPRSLVREYNGQARAPGDIRTWLLRDVDGGPFDNSTFRIWMAAAAMHTLHALPDEIDPVNGSLKFKGPPRLALHVSTDVTEVLSELGIDGFKNLQRGVRWVFENAREAEMRHALFATEVARSGIETDRAEIYLREHAEAALDGAKIAYQASLAQLSSETLKALADLRKAVTEETAKVTEATRQIVGAVAAALAVGIGLMAARVTSTASGNLIIAIMIVAAAYVSMVILSGLQFTWLQRDLRRGWQSRLYRYLPRSEYQALVLTPTGRAEVSLFWVAGIGGFITLIISALVIFPKIWT
ncbi:hypothetical protein [Sphingomonas sp. GM_Shp_1]|uniref:hypothetical protein n=1 Tax=Sphingomonas sp. GM_Shp_1 TaxID=2937381 RepID=UPI00226B5F9A|nr:hypothetical protein [Sphingomonas sp. GM_Shp_1]